MKIKEVKVGALKKYMNKNDTLHGLVPDIIRLANIEVVNLNLDQNERYLMMMENFNVKPMWINENIENLNIQKNYTFLLVMPLETVMDKVEKINNEVKTLITVDFIGPFIVFVIFMIVFISYILKKISIYITEPIIELFK